VDLHCEAFNGHDYNNTYIVDRDNGGEVVGLIRSRGTGFGRRGGIEVFLFDGKYTAVFGTAPECRAFVRGVETVLNHMLPAKQKKPKLKPKKMKANAARSEPASVNGLVGSAPHDPLSAL
jgi:hypothetical protein